MSANPPRTAHHRLRAFSLKLSGNVAPLMPKAMYAFSGISWKSWWMTAASSNVPRPTAIDACAPRSKSRMDTAMATAHSAGPLKATRSVRATRYPWAMSATVAPMSTAVRPRLSRSPSGPVRPGGAR